MSNDDLDLGVLIANRFVGVEGAACRVLPIHFRYRRCVRVLERMWSRVSVQRV